MEPYDEARQAVLDTVQRLVDAGLLSATGGNVSTRIGDEELLAVTPSSTDYRGLTRDDILVCDFERKVIVGEGQPSVETGMHVAVYRARDDVNAVIHTHQVEASAFALTGEPIPPLTDEQVYYLGPRVEVVPYGLSGSEQLLTNIASALGNRCNAFLLESHGALLLGLELTSAALNAERLEKTAAVYRRARALDREVRGLPAPMADALFSMLKSGQRAEKRRRKKAREAAAKAAAAAQLAAGGEGEQA